MEVPRAELESPGMAEPGQAGSSSLLPPGRCHAPSCSRHHLEEEDVGALHAGVENLRGAELIRLIAAHDLGAADDALQVVLPRNVHHQRPVLIGTLVDLLCRRRCGKGGSTWSTAGHPTRVHALALHACPSAPAHTRPHTHTHVHTRAHPRRRGTRHGSCPCPLPSRSPPCSDPHSGSSSDRPPSCCSVAQTSRPPYRVGRGEGG